jgi:peptide-methionine (S)-S-oxide reductase
MNRGSSFVSQILLLALCGFVAASCGGAAGEQRAATARDLPKPALDLPAPRPDEHSRSAIFAGGCFWCTQGVFENVKGVIDAVAGYAGGTADTANYEHYMESNHAEVARVVYDPQVISYGELLRILFTVSEPTAKDRQGPDAGHQYRMAIFYENDDQRRVAEAYIKQLTDVHVYDEPIQTTVEPLPSNGFFPAEDYHQHFVQKNPQNPYVQAWSLPKLHVLREKLDGDVKGQGQQTTTTAPTSPR